jgi:seryl-tRNA synthetase
MRDGHHEQHDKNYRRDVRHDNRGHHNKPEIRQDFKDVRNARNEVKQDRRELRRDHQELRKDRAELRRDIHNGASKQEIFKDRQEIRDDLKEINKDRTELRHDQGTLQSARGELKQICARDSLLTSTSLTVREPGGQACLSAPTLGEPPFTNLRHKVEIQSL